MGRLSQSGAKASKTTPTLPDWANKALQSNVGAAQNVLGTSLVGDKPLTAGFTDAQLQGQQMALQGAQGQQNLINQGRDIFGSLQNFGSANDPLLQQRLQQIADLTNRNLQENIMPGIRTGAVQAGLTGSSRQGIAEGIAARGALEQATRSQTDLLANAEQQRLTATQAALGYMPQLLQQELVPAQTYSQVGAEQQALEQKMLSEPLMRQAAELERLTGLSNITAQQVSPLVGSSTENKYHKNLADKFDELHGGG